jgi:formylglycine-generating enzyme required for sulfatase activity
VQAGTPPSYAAFSVTWQQHEPNAIALAYVLEPQTNRALRPQGTFDTTSQGIVDLNGSVWEWTMECYAGAAGGQSSPDRCPAFYVGGEHIAVMSFLVRDPARGGCAVGTPPAHLGMRLVSERATINRP